MANATPPPGTADIFPEEVSLWYRLENSAREVFSLYGFGELRTPIFEYTEVFKRGLGDQTEVVQKEMYSFDDRGGRSLTLRPEGTAGIMRALLNTDVMNGNEKRVFYIGPMFRGERPAAGRRRQFHQIGVENAGRVAPELDAECIAMLLHFLSSVGITGSKLLLNTRGGLDDRKAAEQILREYFKSCENDLCPDCRKRLDINIWRILDCKIDSCRKLIAAAPEYTAGFSQASQDYFKRVCELLTDMNIEFTVDPCLVRGLDYYVHTVFEIVHSGLGAQNAIAGGGRYELFLPEAGKPVSGVGFALGMERLLMVQEALQVPPPPPLSRPVFLASLGDKAKVFNLKMAMQLRQSGIATVVEAEDRSLKAQMRAANRFNSKFVVICGESELGREVVLCKNMESGEQLEMKSSLLIEFIISQLSNK
jgi:histidyl-tRNA synthetase